MRSGRSFKRGNRRRAFGVCAPGATLCESFLRALAVGNPRDSRNGLSFVGVSRRSSKSAVTTFSKLFLRRIKERRQVTHSHSLSLSFSLTFPLSGFNEVSSLRG